MAMRAPRVLIAVLATGVLATGVLAAACGDDGTSDTSPADTTGASTPDSVPDTPPAPDTVEPTVATTTPGTSAATPPATTAAPSPQLAIWPATDVVFTSPEQAAVDFVTEVFGFPGVIGPFNAGDSRSGEIEVFASEDGTTPVGPARSTLLLRQLPPADGWFVLAAVSDGASIEAPASGATVPAGPVTVEGLGTGFEATISVECFVVGRPDPSLDEEVTMAGNFGELLPYSVVLDVGAASPGDVVVLLVRGGAGLETDPGDFAALPVLIAG
jgi:hypothetical protein